jgi:RNA polymerase sigma-70 factor, ECF subfamily
LSTGPAVLREGDSGTREDAADLLQETFLRIFRARDRLRDVDHLKSYCFRIAHNEMLRWRKSHRGKPTNGQLLYEIADAGDASALELRETVGGALNRLPTHYRQVVELKFFSGLTFAEISEVLEKPQGTVATWYRRALEQLEANVLLDQER